MLAHLYILITYTYENIQKLYKFNVILREHSLAKISCNMKSFSNKF